jgi:hypothetical protein
MRASAFVGSPVGERGSQRYRRGGGERETRSGGRAVRRFEESVSVCRFTCKCVCVCVCERELVCVCVCACVCVGERECAWVMARARERAARRLDESVSVCRFTCRHPR